MIEIEKLFTDNEKKRRLSMSLSGKLGRNARRLLQYGRV